MKISVSRWVIFMGAFAALGSASCASETRKDVDGTASDEQPAGTDTGSATNDDDTSTGTSDTGSGSGAQDTGTGSATQDTTTHSSTQDNDTTPDTQTQVDTDPVDLCDAPSGFLDVPATASYVVFNAAGHLNALDAASPIAAEASVQAQYKGETIDLSSGGVVAYYSSNGQRALFKMSGAPDQDGRFYYAEAKISVFDLMDLNAGGDHLLDLYDGEEQTTLRVYEAWQGASGGIDKLCLLGVPFETAFYYACTTGIDYSTNIGEPFAMAGNIEIYDDTEFLSTTEYAMCLCDNGAGSWRSCDPGIPDDYGLLRLSFRDGPEETDYFSKYVFDESKLWTAGGALDTTYVGAHEAGVWRHTFSFMTGGLNILTSGGLGELIYGFGESIPAGMGVIGLVSHDVPGGMIVVREQSFETLDEGSSPVGLWLVAYVPDGVAEGDLVTFGTGAGTAKLFAYDPSDPGQCIQAIACDSTARIQTASDLDAAEGGQFELRSEEGSDGSRFSVRLVYPGESETCDIETYLAEAGLPADAAICDKL